MTALSARQMADILFQRPGRVTEGILEKRSLWERARDYWLSWNDGLQTRGQWVDEWHNRRRSSGLFLEFTRVSHVKEEHPRSLKKALLELKALGFSNIQAMAAKESLQALLGGLTEQDSFDIPVRMKKEFPGMVWHYSDGAFLGLGAFDAKNIKAKAGNTILTTEMEEELYELFIKTLTSEQATNPQLFTPQRTRSETIYLKR